MADLNMALSHIVASACRIFMISVPYLTGRLPSLAACIEAVGANVRQIQSAFMWACS
jgi:hypothetical protein